MNTEFTSDFFAGNRERLRSLFTGTAPIVLTANGLLQRNSDVTYPFRQDSTFWYFTGITEPDVILVMDKSKEYLIVPERDDGRAAFDGSIDQSSLSEISGVGLVYESLAGWKLLASRLKKAKHVATLGASAAYVEQHGMYTNPARARLVEQFKEYNAELELLDLRSHITRMRSIKQPLELEAIQHAIDITVHGFKKVQKQLSKFGFEYEVEAAFTSHFRSNNVDHAYGPIVAAGSNACTLHYVDNKDVITNNSLLLLDIGAESSYYAADITRTYSVGQPSRRQQQVFDMVIAVQDYALTLCTPGVTLKDIEDPVQAFMGEKLRELGLIKNIDTASVRKYYPHATSHFLGLDVHDVGEYDRPLEAGMVLTVEPGIYIPEESIGVRIEDNIVIEETGHRILSSKLPRVLE